MQFVRHLARLSGLKSRIMLWRKASRARVIAMAIVLPSLAACAGRAALETQTLPVHETITVQPTPAVKIPAQLQERRIPALASIEITDFGDDGVGYQRPGYLAAELTTRDVTSISLVGGMVREDGARRVLLHRPVDPQPYDDEWPGSWADGVNDVAETWDFSGDFLWDGQNGDFTVLWKTEPEASTRTVHGRFRAAGEDEYRDSILVISLAEGNVEDVIETSTGKSQSRQSGDEFQLTNLMLNGDDTMQGEPGTSLFFDEGAQLAYASRPLPSGSYFLGLTAETADGDEAARYATCIVNNDNLSAGYRAFLDTQDGFQFLYPETWIHSVEKAGSNLFSAPSGATQLRVSTHPDMQGRPAVDLKRMALDAYGDVTILYEDQTEVGQSGGLRTVYGYDSDDGPRTGILLTFAQDGKAFVMDLEGPAADEASLLELAGNVARSWTSRPLVSDRDGHWVEATIDGLPIMVPANYRYGQLSNGWHHFADDGNGAFLAFRSESAVEQGLFDRMDYWKQVAADDARDFGASNAYVLERGGRSWSRIDFEYATESGQHMMGSIMVTRIGERFLVIWSEGPADRYQQLEETTFLVVMDDISHRQPLP